MGLLDGLNKINQGMSIARSIHQNGVYFADQIKQQSRTRVQSLDSFGFTFNIPDKAVVNEPVMASGKAPPNTIVMIYSSDLLEETVYPTPNGEYAAQLFFSKKGYYDMYAVLNGAFESKHITVDVS